MINCHGVFFFLHLYLLYGQYGCVACSRSTSIDIVSFGGTGPQKQDQQCMPDFRNQKQMHRDQQRDE